MDKRSVNDVVAYFPFSWRRTRMRGTCGLSRLQFVSAVKNNFVTLPVKRAHIAVSHDNFQLSELALQYVQNNV